MKQNKTAIDLKTDYHAHILPGCDHGSDSVETSLKQLKMAKSAGVETICATPHFYPNNESVKSFLSRRSRTFEILKAASAENDPKILLGAEVLICDGMDRMEHLPDLCLEGTSELLLEMPFYEWPDNIWDTVFSLNDMEEIDIIIAHADRYPAKNIEVLIDAGIPLQLNAGSLTHVLRRSKYMSWIENGYVAYIGSDIHGLGDGYREFEKSVQLIKHRLGIQET